MSYLLTLEAVKTAARAAYEGEQLGFQRGELNCLYRGITGAPCAVGAALPAYLLEDIAGDPELNNATVVHLAETGWITFASAEEADAIFAIQCAHDDLVAEVPYDLRGSRPVTLPAFEELLGIEQ